MEKYKRIYPDFSRQSQNRILLDPLSMPPNPLMQKCSISTRPALHNQEVSFVKLPEFPGPQPEIPFQPPAKIQNFPQLQATDCTLKSVMEQNQMIYIRQPVKSEHVFNLNTLDLSKRILQLQKITPTHQNPMLLDTLEPFYKPSAQQKTLVFQSRFQSGNLQMASKVSNYQYNLLVQNDINTYGHTQWFFFKVSNTFTSHPVKFTIINFCKTDSLFNHGMKISIFSMKSPVGWTKGGKKIIYYPNGIPKQTPIRKRCYFSLSFSYLFQFQQDQVYFAYSIPYTFTQLQKSLDSLQNNRLRSQYLQRKVLSKTLGGNYCEYLTITNPGNLDSLNKRRAAVISARTHPGQTVGSLMMEGVLQFLTSQHPEARILREKYVFKIVPMINPDGVINGNYRCSLGGCDLNRRWKNPSDILQPVVFKLKELIRKLAERHPIDLICDLHGHSRSHNVFMYGCNYKDMPHSCKLFPFIFSKISPVFSFQNCNFGVQKSKNSTMRVSLFKQQKIPNVFTLEASFCGANKGEFSGMHFSTCRLAEVGRDLCRTLLVFSNKPQIISLPIEQQTQTQNKNKFNIDVILQEMKADESILYHEGQDSQGSDSDPSDDNLPEYQLNFLTQPPVMKEKDKKILKKQPKLPKKSLKFYTQRCKCGKLLSSAHNCKNIQSHQRQKLPVLQYNQGSLQRKNHSQLNNTHRISMMNSIRNIIYKPQYSRQFQLSQSPKHYKEFNIDFRKINDRRSEIPLRPFVQDIGNQSSIQQITGEKKGRYLQFERIELHMDANNEVVISKSFMPRGLKVYHSKSPRTLYGQIGFNPKALDRKKNLFSISPEIQRNISQQYNNGFK